MNLGPLQPAALVSLQRIEALKKIHPRADGSVTVGAMATHRTVALTECFSEGLDIVRQAARRIAHPAIRTMGTIGGSICHDEPCAPRRRLAGGWDRRARDSTGIGLCARTQARPGECDHRLSGYQAHAADHAHADRRRARDLLCDRNCHRPINACENRRRTQERTRACLVADACCQGIFDRHRFGSRIPRHTGARRNGLCRGNRCGAALP